MKKPILITASIILTSLSTSVCAHDWTSARPDGHAPIGVMGDHTHKQGDWMVSYRYMRMDMAGNRNGDTQLNATDVLGSGYTIVPESMSMDMHMVGVMYAPINRLTLSAMLPYTFISMDHVTGAGGRFTTESNGVGDFGLSGLLKLGHWGGQEAHLNLGLTAPTGSTDERDATPMGPNSPLPYPMQLGSGTWDAVPGITYLGQTDKWSWGGQGLATLRLGRNDEGYSLGDRYKMTGWLARSLCNNASVSFRMDGQTWGNVDGADRRLPGPLPTMVPAANPTLRGGNRVDALLGVNIYMTQGIVKGHRIAVEGGIPVYQYLDGPQLETDWLFTVGWQYAW